MHILVVDDDDRLRKLLKEFLTKNNFNVSTSRNAEKAKIVCNNIWKIFGDNPSRIIKNLDQSLSRADIQENTGHVVAVKDVSFSIQKGETFVVMGLSGSGKSTLVRCLSRLIEPTAGEILIDEANIINISGKELTEMRRHKMSMVFQHFGLFPHRKVIENISYGLEIRGSNRLERMDRAMEVLKLVGLDGWENNYPRELSGGMQQRVGLARALAVDPEILIFDEPFSALDPLIRREMQDELLNIQKLVKKTMVFITHDFLEAIKMGDHIAIMKDGEISQIGTPEEIVANPADQYVKDFTEDVPKYKVLSAGKVMRETIGVNTKKLFKDRQHCVLESDKIDQLIDLISETDTPVPVTSANGKKLVGEIDRTIVMKAMSSRS